MFQRKKKLRVFVVKSAFLRINQSYILSPGLVQDSVNQIQMVWMMHARWSPGCVPGSLVFSHGLDNGWQVIWIHESFRWVIRRLSGGLMYIQTLTHYSRLVRIGIESPYTATIIILIISGAWLKWLHFTFSLSSIFTQNKYISMHVHSSIIHSSQRMEKAPCSSTDK